MSVTVNGSSGLTFNDGSVQNTAPSGFGFKNRLINSAMMIDQRNAGASVTVNDGDNLRFVVDRFAGLGTSTAGVFTLQQSTTAPTGFVNSIIATITTSSTPSGSNTYQIQQNIEGLNVSDLGWGTANAQPVTLSFWVRSSITGTFGGSLRNSASNRAYPFSYNISAANTWEQKSITISGDTTGTWLTTNGIGIRLVFSLGGGSDRLGTAGAWNATSNTGATGQVNLIGTNGATFYITGVQLEKGSTATSFDYRPYGTELALCQRYYQQSTSFQWMYNIGSNDQYRRATINFKSTMRTSPTIANITTSGATPSETGTQFIGVDNFSIFADLSSGTYIEARNWTASAEL